MRKFFICEELLKISCASATVDNDIIVSRRNSIDCLPEQAHGNLGKFGRCIKCAQILLMKKVIKLVHQVFEAHIRFARIRKNIIRKNIGLTNLSDNLYFALCITKKVALAGIRAYAIEMFSSPNNTVLIYVDSHPAFFAEEFDQTFGV